MNREALVRSQTELFGRISRAYDNLRKTTSSTKITLGLVEARLQSLEANWTKFEAQHDKLLCEESYESLDYVKQDVPMLAEEAFLNQKGLFLDTIKSFRKKADAENGTDAPTTTPSTAPRTTLPRIQLPHFSGKYEDWPAFRDLFQSIIGKDLSLTPVEKFHYLKVCLKGEPELLIRNLTTTGENYGRAWETLRAYYENKRMLVRAYLANFVALPKMKVESAVELRKIVHGLKATVNSLEGIGRPISNSEDLFVYLAVELLDPRSRREWERAISDTIEPPTCEELEQFLDRRLHALEALTPVKTDSATTKASPGTPKSTRNHLAQKQGNKGESKQGRCVICQKEHFVMYCDAYKRKTAQERKQCIEEKDLCLNCLGRHKVGSCASKKDCAVCNARHHTSLHEACREIAVVASTLLAQGHSRRPLATARIQVADRVGTWHPARALVDQGSESTLISERLAQRLKLQRSSIAMTVYGVGGKKTGVAKGRVDLAISPRTGDSPLRVSAIVLPRLTVYTGGVKTEAKTWPHLQGLVLADPEFLASDPIDVILGADAYAAILCRGIRKGGAHEPVAQRTTLGWILSGEVGKASTAYHARFHQCRIEEDLAVMVRRLWEQEELPVTTAAFSKDERECEEHFVHTHSRDANGRYTVRLPFNAPLPDLSGTRRTAERVLRHIEKRFSRDASFHELYVDFMRPYSDLGHMTPIFVEKNDERKRAYYLPHHGVLREESTTSKLRVVFNGSSAVPSGDTLNKYLHPGPNLLPALPDILLRWRRHRFAIATDIEKMYRQINIHPADRDLQRILWRRYPDDDILAFRLNTVTYGLTCAPFLAIRTLRQLADDESGDFPLGAAVLRQDVYMDDILTGSSSLEATREIQEQLRQICTAGGFPLKKWSANAAELLETLPAEDRLQKEPRWWRSGESHLTLGVRWHPHDDKFVYAIPPIKMDAVTKRTVLSFTSRLFDPLGWLAPTTLRAKVWIQSTWLLGIDWDAPLPDDDVRRWLEFREELPALEDIQVPRWLTSGAPGGRAEIHGFSDASERGYAAVAYLRTTESDGRVNIRLIAAKTKVAPLKQVTLPRLELSAAALLARLVMHIRNVLEMKDTPTHLWSDSTVTLGWIQGHPSAWKTYVANRVSEIQTTLPDARWHYIRGTDNPADCASRGLSPKDLVSHPLWWTGPVWLATEEERWTASEEKIAAELPDRRVLAHATSSEKIVEPELFGLYSSLPRLLRITAWCLRWLRRSPKMRARIRISAASSVEPLLQASDLAEARLFLLRIVQAKHFDRDLAALDKGKPLPANSVLIPLSPFKDSHGILRVGGRLRHAKLSFDQRHLAILPGDSQFTRLTIDACHRRTLHGGVQLTLGALRQEFWVPRGRALVISCIHHCLTCLRWRAASPQPLMGDLPAARVTPARPFLNTGVDYAGPIWVRTSKGRGQRASKAFIVVFICLSSRAVHLDVASDYSADAFLAALRRFVARRGLCQVLHSDCGTNFVGADVQLRDLFAKSSLEGRRLAAHLAEERIQWRFNPPAAPNFGGICEAAVKSAKYHLRRVIGDATLTYEEMTTLLAQVETCLNSRPLQAVSDDPEDLMALTPGHFLIGSALIAIPEPCLTQEPTNRLSRWQLLQSMRDHFWKRWSQEYLHTLAHRPKWTKTLEEIRVGRLCLLRSEATSPQKWPLARVEEVHPVADGQIRVVSLRTATTRLTRPVNKLILLPSSVTSEDAPSS